MKSNPKHCARPCSTGERSVLYERCACLEPYARGPAMGTSISPVLSPRASRITSCPCALACRWSRLARVRLDTLPCEYPIAHETTQPLTVQTMLGSQEVKKVCMMGQALFSPEEPSNALQTVTVGRRPGPRVRCDAIASVAAKSYPSGFAVPVIVPVLVFVPVVFGRYALSASERQKSHQMPIFIALGETI